MSTNGLANQVISAFLTTDRSLKKLNSKEMVMRTMAFILINVEGSLGPFTLAPSSFGEVNERMNCK